MIITTFFVLPVYNCEEDDLVGNVGLVLVIYIMKLMLSIFSNCFISVSCFSLYIANKFCRV